MSSRPARLVLVGSVIVDLMMTVPALPERGGDVLAGAAVAQAGGGFNVLAAAARLGMPCALAGLVGTGPLGDIVAAALAAEGVELLVPRAQGDTGLCVGFVEPDGERTFVTSAGVESRLHADDLGAVRLGPGDAAYLSGYDLCYPVSGPVVADWLERERPSDLLLDPGPLAAGIPVDLLGRVLRHTSVLSLSGRELELLGGDVRGLLARCAPGAGVVVRDGARGCVVHSPGLGPAGVAVPAPAVQVVDTTGAGDAHAGALLAGLGRGLDLVEACRLANAAAAIAVGRLGSATGPASAELSALLDRGRRPAPPEGE